MTKTVFEPSIRSRPVYSILSPRDGSAHLLVADGEGADAIVEMFAKAGEGEDVLTSTLEFKDKHFFANGQQLQ